MNRYTVMALIALATFPAYAGSLPPLINFQSVLLDEGGNLLPSGPTTIQFQVLDENRVAIYSESQSVEVVKGAATALIGNGADDKGVPTGGIPEDIFDTGAPRYLQVQVGSHAPEDPMTIVPVPYSQWSATCATVAEGGVKPASIAKAAVGFEALAPDVVSKLAEALSTSQGVLTAQSLGSTSGATQVGVTSKFINSGSSTVQGVLQDLDLSVKKGQETDTFLTGKLNDEVTNRTNAVAGVQSKLEFETNSSNVGSLAQKIVSEALTRSGADGILTSNISDINTKVLNDINNIPGKLKLDHLEPNSSATSDLNMGGYKIINLVTPTNPTDPYAVANQKYVDDSIATTGVATRKYVDDTAEALKAQTNAQFDISNQNQAHIYYGSYIGTGSEPKAITGVGGMPKILIINYYASSSGTFRNTNVWLVSDQGAGNHYVGFINNINDSLVIPLSKKQIQPNADGFTIITGPTNNLGEPSYNQKDIHYDFIAQW